MSNIIVDGITYRLRIVFDSLSRSFEIMDGPNGGVSMTGAEIRDIIGTKYHYTMAVEPDPKYPEDYDAFYQVISSPTASHQVSLPYGQGRLAFEAMILSGDDTYGGKVGDFNRWHGLVVEYKAFKPQREA